MYKSKMMKKCLTAVMATLLASGLAVQYGCKTYHEEFNITGVWKLTSIRDDDSCWTCKYIFIGTNEMGEIKEYPEDNVYSYGVYSVVLNQVYLSTWGGRGTIFSHTDFSGSVISNDYLEGTLAGRSVQGREIAITWTGTWSATRYKFPSKIQ